jgi:hypothetical protein
VTGPTRVAGPLLDVAGVFLQAFNEDAPLHGWAITKATTRSWPTVYGVLDRREDAAWITGQWEDQHPGSNKPRRLYRLTPPASPPPATSSAPTDPKFMRAIGARRLRNC